MVQRSSTALSWDDLAAIRAVGRARTVRAAAEALGVAHTTLARRIEAAETALGAVAFVRGPRGYTPTEAGRAIIAHAERMAEEVESLGRTIAGGDRSPRGLVRVTMPPAILVYCIAHGLPAFHATYPAIDLDIDTGYGFRDLDRQDADVAVRLQTAPQDDLIGIRVGDGHEACYASADVAACVSGKAGASFPLVAWSRGNEFRRRAATLGFDNPTLGPICLDVLGQLAMAEAGVGAAILPCIVGDASAKLVRLPPGRTVPVHAIWVLNHADLRQSARVRAVSAFLVEVLRASLARLAGQSGARSGQHRARHA